MPVLIEPTAYHGSFRCEQKLKCPGKPPAPRYLVMIMAIAKAVTYIISRYHIPGSGELKQPQAQARIVTPVLLIRCPVCA